MKSSQLFVGEVKIKSPYTKLNRPKSFKRLLDLAINHSDIVSIHTNPLWGGKFEDIVIANERSSAPILAKGIHPLDDDIREAINLGATYVLVCGRIPKDDNLLPYCWLEPYNIEQLKLFAKETDCTLVWNSRNLKDGSLKEETLEDALSVVMSNQIIQASNISKPSDVSDKVSGFIVGTMLSQFIKTYA